MKSKVIGIVCGALAVMILLSSQKQPDPVPPTPPVPEKDIVEQSFDIYEDLWRKHALAAADKLKTGELDTDQKAWEFLAAGQEPARKVAFDEIAQKEQAYFDERGGWSPEAHEALLRSYQK